MSDFKHPTRKKINPEHGWQGVANDAGMWFFEDKPSAPRVFRFNGEVVYLETGEPMVNPRGSLAVDEELLLVTDTSGKSQERYLLTRDEVAGSRQRFIAHLIEEAGEAAGGAV